MYGLTDESGRQTNRCGQTADLAGLRRILERFGNRSYRAVQLEAGVLGGKLYLGLDLWWRVELWLPGLRLATFQSKARVH